MFIRFSVNRFLYLSLVLGYAILPEMFILLIGASHSQDYCNLLLSVDLSETYRRLIAVIIVKRFMSL